MTDIKIKLPLKIAHLTPSVIVTNDQKRISCTWSDNTLENPYEDAEQFAAFIIKASNAHYEMIEALEECAEYLEWVSNPDRPQGETSPIQDDELKLMNMCDEALSRAKGSNK